MVTKINYVISMYTRVTFGKNITLVFKCGKN